ncbi:MAG: Asp-tRNA(Asn)/Glu-tRNA(Gln) amidotransferase subunit GatC [Nitrospirae bacterium]|nr:Asp-tRNA(Asn)/Glu-tRNA(Gln) amidotransferase subunit GatC [Nitrospirota bacterium]
MEIERVAILARIKLAEGEKELFSKQLGSILQYIDKLNELDTKEVEPTSHVLSMKNIFREDRTIPSLSKDQALLNAPDSAGDFYRVPKIIE